MPIVPYYPRTPGPHLEGCRAGQASCGSEVFLGAGFEGELLVIAVVVVELGVAAPVDGRVELAARLAEREAATEDVDEEPDAQGVVRGGGEGLSDGADKGRVLGGVPCEQLLAGEDVRGGELLAVER